LRVNCAAGPPIDGPGENMVCSVAGNPGGIDQSLAVRRKAGVHFVLGRFGNSRDAEVVESQQIQISASGPRGVQDDGVICGRDVQRDVSVADWPRMITRRSQRTTAEAEQCATDDSLVARSTQSPPSTVVLRTRFVRPLGAFKYRPSRYHCESNNLVAARRPDHRGARFRRDFRHSRLWRFDRTGTRGPRHCILVSTPHTFTANVAEHVPTVPGSERESQARASLVTAGGKSATSTNAARGHDDHTNERRRRYRGEQVDPLRRTFVSRAK